MAGNHASHSFKVLELDPSTKTHPPTPAPRSKLLLSLILCLILALIVVLALLGVSAGAKSSQVAPAAGTETPSAPCGMYVPVLENVPQAQIVVTVRELCLNYESLNCFLVGDSSPREHGATLEQGAWGFDDVVSIRYARLPSGELNARFEVLHAHDPLVQSRVHVYSIAAKPDGCVTQFATYEMVAVPQSLVPDTVAASSAAITASETTARIRCSSTVNYALQHSKLISLFLSDPSRFARFQDNRWVFQFPASSRSISSIDTASSDLFLYAIDSAPGTTTNFLVRSSKTGWDDLPASLKAGILADVSITRSTGVITCAGGVDAVKDADLVYAAQVMYPKMIPRSALDSTSSSALPTSAASSTALRPIVGNSIGRRRSLDFIDSTLNTARVAAQAQRQVIFTPVAPNNAAIEQAMIKSRSGKSVDEFVLDCLNDPTSGSGVAQANVRDFMKLLDDIESQLKTSDTRMINADFSLTGLGNNVVSRILVVKPLVSSLSVLATSTAAVLQRIKLLTSIASTVELVDNCLDDLVLIRASIANWVQWFSAFNAPNDKQIRDFIQAQKLMRKNRNATVALRLAIDRIVYPVVQAKKSNAKIDAAILKILKTNTFQASLASQIAYNVDIVGANSDLIANAASDNTLSRSMDDLLDKAQVWLDAMENILDNFSGSADSIVSSTYRLGAHVTATSSGTVLVSNLCPGKTAVTIPCLESNCRLLSNAVLQTFPGGSRNVTECDVGSKTCTSLPISVMRDRSTLACLGTMVRVPVITTFVKNETLGDLLTNLRRNSATELAFTKLLQEWNPNRSAFVNVISPPVVNSNFSARLDRVTFLVSRLPLLSSILNTCVSSRFANDGQVILCSPLDMLTAEISSFCNIPAGSSCESDTECASGRCRGSVCCSLTLAFPDCDACVLLSGRCQTTTPTMAPSTLPTVAITLSPSLLSAGITKSPSFLPTATTGVPSGPPVDFTTTLVPSVSPSEQVMTDSPEMPSRKSTEFPTRRPTAPAPTKKQTPSPTFKPTITSPSRPSRKVSNSPSKSPTNLRPTRDPTTLNPTTMVPSESPTTASPTVLTDRPTLSPTTLSPSTSPSRRPSTRSPTSQKPTRRPSNSPSTSPTIRATLAPQSSLCQNPTGGCLQLASKLKCDSFSGCDWDPVLNACQALRCSLSDCKVKQVTFQATATLLPGCRLGYEAACDEQRMRVFEELKLAACGASFIPASRGGALLLNEKSRPLLTIDNNGDVFVSPTGLDANNGRTPNTPYLTLERALTETRKFLSGNKPKIVLLPGSHHVAEAATLGVADSGLTILGSSHPDTGKSPRLTATITLTNQVWIASSNPRILKTSLSGALYNKLGKMSALIINGEPAIRARYPDVLSPFNFNYEDSRSVSYWTRFPGTTPPLIRLINKLIPANDDPKAQYHSASLKFNKFTMGYGGNCARSFNPPASYFCHPQHEAYGGCEYTLPGSVVFTPSKFQFPSLWKNPKTAYFHTMHSFGWGLWTFSVGTQTRNSVTFKDGGWQEARGDCGKGGGNWYVENVLELLDSPGEYFLDLEALTLYYYPPSIGMNPMLNPRTVTVELNYEIRNVLTINGAKNVIIRNIEFWGGYPTHMDDHDVPSGGDWSVHRGGVVFIEKSENVAVQECQFHHSGGNAIFINHYARNIRIERNEFYAIGSSAVLMVGDPKLVASDPWNIVDYPENVLMYGNVVSHFGMIVKQSAGAFVSLGKNVLVEENVIFHAPRAGIVFNDGFGGGNTMRRNIVFSTVRETSDHGPLDSWDRQPYVEDWPKDPFVVAENLVLGNAIGPKGIDLDDGAFNYVSEGNVVVWGYQKFKGSLVVARNNLILFPIIGSCAFITPMTRIPTKWTYVSNICVSDLPPYAYNAGPLDIVGLCSPLNFITGDNTFYYTGSDSTWPSCGSTDIGWPAWQRSGQDLTSKFIRSAPSLGDIERMMLTKLVWVGSTK